MRCGGGSASDTAALGYRVIFLAEWGDLTQILTANLAAKYHNPVSVGIVAVLGLWAVGLLAVLGGRTLHHPHRLPPTATLTS